jgi:hypothetical protein
MNVEEGDDIEQRSLSMQKLINDGQAWKMQGSMGRGMMSAIESGFCMLGVDAKFDYYGNYIPSRSQVQEGTKGSRSYVVDRMGEEWALMLEAV